MADQRGFTLSDLELGLCFGLGYRATACLVAQRPVRATIPTDHTPMPMVWEIMPRFVAGSDEACWGVDFTCRVEVKFIVAADLVTLEAFLLYPDEAEVDPDERSDEATLAAVGEEAAAGATASISTRRRCLI